MASGTQQKLCPIASQFLNLTSKIKNFLPTSYFLKYVAYSFFINYNVGEIYLSEKTPSLCFK